MNTRWSVERAWDWYQSQAWMVGCNFIPSNSVNQLEMWQEDTFDAPTIKRELGWAQSLGFNTVRVFLHDLLWLQDSAGFKSRIDSFLHICAQKAIKPIFVFFDDCWNQDFAIGEQPEPKPGVHNSGWVQSPGRRLVLDPSAWGNLKTYVQGILARFEADKRIRMWDLYNEPGSSQLGEQSLGLLRAVFAWAREVKPAQPLTAGVYSANETLNQFQTGASDIISFHNYASVQALREQITRLKTCARPLVCTEYMARGRNSLFETHLPVFIQERIGCLNWGLVNGKTQTHLPWSSEPPAEVWFHDIFHPDGRPYRQAEVDFIRACTQALPA